MKKKYQFLLSVVIIIIIIFLVIYIFFGVILYRKYRYLWKIVRRMENDKYLWPLSNSVSKKIIENIDLKGDTLLIGVGNCSILDKLVEKQSSKIYVLDSNSYLLDLAKDKHKNCVFINDRFEDYNFNRKFKNVISTLPHKEFSLGEIEGFFKKYFSLSEDRILFFESKMPHVKNTYNSLIINNQNINGKKYDYKVIKNVKNIPPLNLCVIQDVSLKPQTS